MAKAKTVFFCSDCGGESVRWMGRCPHCGSWNTLVEETIRESAPAAPGRVNIRQSRALPIAQVRADEHARYESGVTELDTVLGGGLVPGSTLLLGGEPGIGKSTLLLAAAAKVCRYGRTLYISGEESPEQIRLRAERLNAINDDLYLLAQTEISEALAEARRLTPKLVIIDSVQAVFDANVESAPGSVSQVRAVAAAAIAYARESGAAVLLIGHVTKEGQLAGPRVLEHMVDTVLYFEGDRYNALRLLRAVKNRYGSTNEIGVFEMTETGLQALASPSAYFLAERQIAVPGSAVTCVMQGSRPLLLEVQALVSASNFGNPRRLSSGFDYNRLLLIIAVLERKLGLPLGNKDIYVNAAGGMRVSDQAVDLAVAAAIVSSLKDQAIDSGLLLLGELGLLGEIRAIAQEARRMEAAAAFGFSAAICPEAKKAEKGKLRRLPAKDLPAALCILNL